MFSKQETLEGALRHLALIQVFSLKLLVDDHTTYHPLQEIAWQQKYKVVCCYQ